MFLLIHLFCGLPLIACSVAAGCCEEGFAIRAWTVAAMAGVTILWGCLGAVLLYEGYVGHAGLVLLVWCGCYGVCRLLRFVTRYVRRQLARPYRGDCQGD